MENIAEEMKKDVMGNYSNVKIEDKMIDFDLEIYDPIKDDVINKKISDYK
jgi:hypothetical protein